MDILFIEDEERARLGLMGLLESRGHNVDIAETVDEAVAQIKNKKYDFLLLDIMLGEEPSKIFPKVPPREQGKHLLVELRAGVLENIKTDRDVPVIALTAVSDLRVNMKIKEQKNVLIISKPADPEEVLLQIENFISGGENE